MGEGIVGSLVYIQGELGIYQRVLSGGVMNFGLRVNRDLLDVV